MLRSGVAHCHCRFGLCPSGGVQKNVNIEGKPQLFSVLVKFPLSVPDATTADALLPYTSCEHGPTIRSQIRLLFNSEI